MRASRIIRLRSWARPVHGNPNMATPDLERPPTLAERGTPRPKSSPEDDGPGSPARRRRIGPLGLAAVLILAGLSLMLMVAPAGILLLVVGVIVAVWGALRGSTTDARVSSARPSTRA